MHKIEALLERIAAQNEIIIQQNERILMLLSLRVVERPPGQSENKPKNN